MEVHSKLVSKDIFNKIVSGKLTALVVIDKGFKAGDVMFFYDTDSSGFKVWEKGKVKTKITSRFKDFGVKDKYIQICFKKII